MKVNGVKHIRVAPYHAASNVSGERMVHSFKNHMKACKGSKLSIKQRTSNYVLTYRSTRHPTTGRVTYPSNCSSPKCLGEADVFTSKAESNTCSTRFESSTQETESWLKILGKSILGGPTP